MRKGDEHRWTVEIIGNGTPSSCIICHNGKELLLVDLSVLVQIEFVDHGLAGAEGCEQRLKDQRVILTVHRPLTDLQFLLPPAVDSVD